MHTGDFLRFLFPLRGPDDPRGGDLIRFIAVGRDEGWEDAPIHWRTRAELHTLADPSAYGLGLPIDGKDVYFTPHGFSRRDKHVKKADATELGDVAWVELDDEDLDPAQFTPAPSLQVQTSHGRSHLYWKLADPLLLTEIERINYRLTYGNGLRKDTGGWAITKWLRLPGTASYKRSAPFPVQVADTSAPELVYTAADFDVLPAAPEILHNAAVSTPPDLTKLATADEIRARYPLPKELEEILSRTYPDRSKALWRAYHLCAKVGLSEDETYALIYGSANDKFHAEWRYHGDEGLWQDIAKGFYVARSPEDVSVLRQIEEERFKKSVPPDKRRRTVAEIILKDLRERGRDYFDPTRFEALYYDGARVRTVDPTNQAWTTLMSQRYHIGGGDSDSKAISENLFSLIEADALRITPYVFSHYDPDQHLLYISNNAGKVYVLDGETITLVANGVDGVLFRDQPNLVPVTATADVTAPHLADVVFGLPNFEACEAHTAEQAHQLFRLWACSLFFPKYLPARPLLIFKGPTGAGKSLGLQALAQLLAGPGANVTPVPADKKTWETVISNASYVFFDNVDDERNGWLIDKLAEVATGIKLYRRKLYTTNDMIDFDVSCFVGVTTRDDWFSRIDVANRTLLLRLGRRETKRNPAVLLETISNHRNALWAELLTNLNGIVAQLKVYRSRDWDLRMAAFADFVAAASPVFGYDSTGLIDAIAKTQRESAMAHSPVWNCLEAWLRTPGRDEHAGTLIHNGEKIGTNRLHVVLRAKAKEIGCEEEYSTKVRSAHALTSQLKEVIGEMSGKVRATYEKRDGTYRWAFWLPDVEETAEP